MDGSGVAAAIGSAQRGPSFEELVRTGPGTVAGRYLRSFWQPVYHSADLAAGEVKPLRVLGESFTIYRGAGGTVHLVERTCPHRGTQLTAGHVEGDAIRCFYHGWKFEADGRCVEQPAEDPSFAHRIRIRSYPVREYLGLVFAWLGTGEPPAFPLYPEFEHFEGLLEVDSYERDCNYFQNVDNALDHSHLAFVHGGTDNFGRVTGRSIKVEESDWGMTLTFTRHDGKLFISQYGMPNMIQVAAFPTDPEIGWLESLFWWVPVNDECHMQFGLHRVPAGAAAAQRLLDKRQVRRGEINLAHQQIAAEILAGRMNIRDVDPKRCDIVRLQDDIAQVGQRTIVDRRQDHLGSSDVGVVAVRKLWRRELQAFAESRPTKAWKKPPALRPAVWGLGASAAPAVDPARQAKPQLVDVRPFVEVAIQMKVLGS
jgi:5,5'-dehydrodivanillate O-demethylase oxygenase subunit